MLRCLKEFYRVDTNAKLIRSIIDDICLSIFLWSGSGLLISIVKGMVFPIFIRSTYPVLAGKRLRVRNASNIHMGKHIVIKHDVSLISDGPMRIGDSFIIGERSTLSSYGPGLTIGNHVQIGNDCYIAQHGGSIVIGNDVLIADSVKMYSLNHTFKNKKILLRQQPCEETCIVIHDNVWIGSGVVLFNNVTIGKGAVIGANTVVRTNVPKGVIFAGNPGKVVATY